MSATTRRVADLVGPLAERMGLELYDVEQHGGTLRVLLDREGGVDVDTLADATRRISTLLDEAEPVAGSYTLEVSSPGLERPLRTPAHFAWAVGKQVSVKTVPNHPAGRRLSGTVTAADDHSVTLALDEPAGEPLTLPLDDIEKARTTFEWGPAPKPGGPKKKPSSTSSSTKKKKVQP